MRWGQLKGSDWPHSIQGASRQDGDSNSLPRPPGFWSDSLITAKHRLYKTIGVRQIPEGECALSLPDRKMSVTVPTRNAIKFPPLRYLACGCPVGSSPFRLGVQPKPVQGQLHTSSSPWAKLHLALWRIVMRGGGCSVKRQSCFNFVCTHPARLCSVSPCCLGQTCVTDWLSLSLLRNV